jgi:hypothetical protein
MVLNIACGIFEEIVLDLILIKKRRVVNKKGDLLQEASSLRAEIRARLSGGP